LVAPHGGGGGTLYLSRNTSASSSATEIALRVAAKTLGTKSESGASIRLEYVGGF
jgi:hypothetical protein